MKRDSRRSTFLTLLAAFYLPLSLVTGIFGMNIKEFSDQAPPFYSCFEALFAVIAVTAVFLGLYRYLPLVYWTPKEPLSRRQQERSFVRQLCHKMTLPLRQVHDAFLALERRRQRYLEESESDVASYGLDPM